MKDLKPGTRVPDLSVSTIENSTWRIDRQQPKFATLIVFYRGVHCPICKTYLQELNTKLKDFRAVGVEPIAISGDTEERARKAADDWELDMLDIGYGQTIESMRAWGLYISSAIKEKEPENFGEPGLFLVNAKRELLLAAVQSMPFARPHFADVLSGVKFMLEDNYPPRGTA